jgi:hypothetical protein
MTYRENRRLDQDAARASEARGEELRYSPQYSPDLNQSNQCSIP